MVNDRWNFGLCVVALVEQLPNGFKPLVYLDAETAIVHLCAYANKPTQIDQDFLLKELTSDDQFGLKNYGGELRCFHAPTAFLEIMLDSTD